jgi:hypothetical protein
MKTNVEEEANRFDLNGVMKNKVVEALAKLKTFRMKYPFAEDPKTIENSARMTSLEAKGKKPETSFFMCNITFQTLGTSFFTPTTSITVSKVN